MLARHDRGPRPARPGRRRGARRWPAPPTWPRRRAAGRRRSGSRRRCWPTSWPSCRATRESPSLALGVSPRGRDHAAARGQGVGVAGRPAVRHPRRGQGRGQAGPAPPRRSCGPSWSSRASPPTACSTASSPPSRCPGEPERVTSRTRSPPAALAMAVPGAVGVGRSCWCCPVAAAGRAAGGERGAAGGGRRRLAAGAAARTSSRSSGSCPGSCPLGAEARGRLAGAQPDRRRRGRGSGAAGRRAGAVAAGGDHGGRGCVVPVRGRCGGGDHGPAGAAGPLRRRPRWCVRVEGPLGLVARQGRRRPARRCCGSTRRSGRGTRPSCASTGPASSRSGLRSAQGRGGGTEFDQLREYGVDDEFRRIDWAATARAGKPIVRTYRAERNQTVLLLLDNGRVDGRPGRRRAPGRARHGRGDDADRAWPPASATGAGWSPSTARCGPWSPPGHGPRPARPGDRGDVRARAACWPRATTGAPSPRRWPASAAGPCSSCSPSWSSRRWASPCCRRCR